MLPSVWFLHYVMLQLSSENIGQVVVVVVVIISFVHQEEIASPARSWGNAHRGCVPVDHASTLVVRANTAFLALS